VHRNLGRAAGALVIARTAGVGILLAANLVVADAAFVPAPGPGGQTQYLFVSPSVARLVLWLVVGGAAAALLRLLAPDGFPRFAWLGLSLLPLANLWAPLTGRLTAMTYVLFDLRYAWWAALLATALAPRALAAWRAGPLSRRTRTGLLALVALVPPLVATATSPHLRFSAVLHGDEPKYLRFCENFYQGRGFDISGIRLLADLRPGDAPRVADNLKQLALALGEEAADVARALTGGPAPSSGLHQGPDLFFAGKRPGSVYQLHNPGLSFLIFPGYYLDRRLTGSGVGYHGEFPADLPAVNVSLLALYAGFGLALFGLLRAQTGDRAMAAILALLGMLTMPAAAFAFQIYPEVAAGLIVCIVARLMVVGLPARSFLIVGGGMLAGFLPWLHIRTLAVTAVAVAWVLADRRAPVRRRVLFAAGASIGVLSICVYTFHLTGRLLPTATYGTEPPLSLARVLLGLPGFAFDRSWGVLPLAPIYLLAFAGAGVALRRAPRMLLALALLALVTAVPGAGHGYWAAGATPGRYVVAVVPLGLLLVAEAWRFWRGRPVFTGTAAALALISLETAVRYNLDHVKDVGPLVTPGVAGWRPNLLFPALGTTDWAASPTDTALLAAWVVGAIVLLFVGWRASRQAEDHRPAARRLAFAPLGLSLLAIASVGTVVSAATGLRTWPTYQVTPAEARARAFETYLDVGRCVACWSSARGAVNPTEALGNTTAAVYFRPAPPSPQAGEAFTLLVRPRSTSGDFVLGVIRVDLGDGTPMVERKLYGDLPIEHVYGAPGTHVVHARVRSTAGPAVEGDLTIVVR
jgi:hypothetical protein